MSRDYHGGSVIFSGESLVHKCSRIGCSEIRNSFFYKIQKTKFDLSMGRQHDNSLLFIKHGRNPEQTFQSNRKKFGVISYRGKTFDSRIYTQSEQSNRRLGIPNIPAQQRMKTLSNCFQTNLQPFRETIIRHVCFQTLPLTAMIDT